MAEQDDRSGFLVRHEPAVQLRAVFGLEPGIFKLQPGGLPVPLGIPARVEDHRFLERREGAE